MAKEIFTDADNFGIQFPANLTVEGKATLLAATFLIVSDKERPFTLSVTLQK
jgi:hypothetical protein